LADGNTGGGGGRRRQVGTWGRYHIDEANGGGESFSTFEKWKLQVIVFAANPPNKRNHPPRSIMRGCGFTTVLRVSIKQKNKR
jgi:hypothetical protein